MRSAKVHQGAAHDEDGHNTASQVSPNKSRRREEDGVVWDPKLGRLRCVDEEHESVDRLACWLLRSFNDAADQGAPHE